MKREEEERRYIREKVEYSEAVILVTYYYTLMTRTAFLEFHSTINKLFFINPSPTSGNSGDSCHSPSTKNLISYLQEKTNYRSLNGKKTIEEWTVVSIQIWQKRYHIGNGFRYCFNFNIIWHDKCALN